MEKEVTFDHVFLSWLLQEVEPSEQRDILKLAQSKGFDSIAEWRLATAVRLGMTKKVWKQMIIENPAQELPQIVIGPFQGWSKFFSNTLTTTFAAALEIPEFFDWCKNHNRIPEIAANFPVDSSIILYRKPNGQYLHLEGGHRICAVAYGAKIGKPVQFGKDSKVTAYVADISEEEISKLNEFLKLGTHKQ